MKRMKLIKTLFINEWNEWNWSKHCFITNETKETRRFCVIFFLENKISIETYLHYISFGSRNVMHFNCKCLLFKINFICLSKGYWKSQDFFSIKIYVKVSRCNVPYWIHCDCFPRKGIKIIKKYYNELYIMWLQYYG